MELLGFSSFDIALIVLCPIGGVIGSFAYAIADSIDPSSPNKEEQAVFASKELQEKRGAWLSLRCMLGAILGLVLGLYFVGAIQETPSTLAKIMAFSILAGYAAPKIWSAQDRLVDAKIKQMIDEHEKPNKSFKQDK